MDNHRDLAGQLEAALNARSSATFGRPRWDLAQVYCETCHPNWDGEGAAPVSRQCYNKASAFLASLPAGVPDPDIAADPDGEVSFTWSRGPLQIFSVSVAPTGRLSYAGLYGGNSAHGTEYLVGDALPAVVPKNLARLFSAGA